MSGPVIHIGTLAGSRNRGGGSRNRDAGRGRNPFGLHHVGYTGYAFTAARTDIAVPEDIGNRPAALTGSFANARFVQCITDTDIHPQSLLIFLYAAHTGKPG